MNKSAIKAYAVRAHVQLIESVRRRIRACGVTETGDVTPCGDAISSKTSAKDKESRAHLVERIRQLGFEQAAEDAAYGWFIRFVALRYLEVNGCLPCGVRVFTDMHDAFPPVSHEHPEAGQTDDQAFCSRLLKQCDVLSEEYPDVFPALPDWMLLLVPDSLLDPDGAIGRMINVIDKNDWIQTPEMIGWLYQYYFSEKHNAVIDPLRGKTIQKKDIPAATQLFTTDWVVRYILDNTLGRYWIERHPESKLAEKLSFLALPEDDNIDPVKCRVVPEEIHVMDPCVGTGLFLSYAFDLLLEIYRECGIADRDAANSILAHNLYGLDIDDRAARLARFTLLMKARPYCSAVPRHVPHVLALQDTDRARDDQVRLIRMHDPSIGSALQTLSSLFRNAEEYGSLIRVPSIRFPALYRRLNAIRQDGTNALADAVDHLLPLVHQAKLLSGQYAIVATNPPYLRRFSPVLKRFLEAHYKAFQGDLFSAFMYRCFELCKEDGYCGFMTPMVWMFIRTYAPLRRFILEKKTILSLIQFAYSAFADATVPVCTFVIQNRKENKKALYFKLTDFRGGMEAQMERVLYALQNRSCGYCYEKEASVFAKIPDAPISYWMEDAISEAFERYPSLGAVGTARLGMTTGENARFVRFWFEVDRELFVPDADSQADLNRRAGYWVPYNKGGAFRKWYGNNEHVLYWKDEGRAIKTFADANGRIRSTVPSTDYYFKPCASWSKISTGKISFRFKEHAIFDVAGACYFAKRYDLRYMMGFLNSCVVNTMLAALSPTMNYEGGKISALPVAFSPQKNSRVCEIVDENIDLCRADWDDYETSWDFSKHPLLPETNSDVRIKDLFSAWKTKTEKRFARLRANEEELNRIFINLYALQNVLTPEVDERDVSVRTANLRRDVRSLLSYAVGCMFGRYSVHSEGLQFAGGDWDAWYAKNRQRLTANGQYVNEENILPISDNEGDDLADHFFRWIETTYGKTTAEENLQFIADALGRKGTPREVIRGYIANGFYKDHVKTYQKRPIYWLFSSGKKHGFQALVYMHRYKPDLAEKMYTEYFCKHQVRCGERLRFLKEAVHAAAPAERKELHRRIEKLQDQATEMQLYEQKLRRLAEQKICLNTDDGVKINYAKLYEVLQPPE